MCPHTKLKFSKYHHIQFRDHLLFQGSILSTYAKDTKVANQSMVSKPTQPYPEANFVILFPSLSDPQARNFISKLLFWTASIDGPALENQPNEKNSANLSAVRTSV